MSRTTAVDRHSDKSERQEHPPGCFDRRAPRAPALRGARHAASLAARRPRERREPCRRAACARPRPGRTAAELWLSFRGGGAAARSSFCLCPSGDAPSFTQRLYVAVLSGCVPVRVDAYPRWPAHGGGLRAGGPDVPRASWAEPSCPTGPPTRASTAKNVHYQPHFALPGADGSAVK